jgi:hypothetical protein
MLTRRNFLKGLLSTVATGALVKNGIVQPEQVIAEPKRRVFDMAENTWRSGNGWHFLVGRLNELPPLRGLWPMEEKTPRLKWHEEDEPFAPSFASELLNCRRVPKYEIKDASGKWVEIQPFSVSVPCSDELLLDEAVSTAAIVEGALAFTLQVEFEKWDQEATDRVMYGDPASTQRPIGIIRASDVT